MNKLLRFLIPILLTCLLIGVVFHLARVSRAEAVGLNGSEQGNLIVNTLEDELNEDGDCSLREAIRATNTNAAVDDCPAGEVLTDTIELQMQGTITVTSQLSVTAGGALVIDGADAITTTGSGLTRIWWVETGSELILQHLKVINGSAHDYGAGLYNNAASVTIDGCEFTHNSFQCSMYACTGAGIFSLDGTLNVLDSKFLNNGQAYDLIFGGAIGIHGGTARIQSSLFQGNTALGDWYENEDPGGGAVWIGASSVNIMDSSFKYNDGGHGGGAIANEGTLTVTNSTLAGNYALNLGGKGGAVDNFGSLTITNSTFSDNRSAVGGGISNYHGTASITNSTFSENRAKYGGGINNFDTTIVYLSNTIVANNVFGGDCSGSIFDNGHNLDSDGTCGLDPAQGSITNTNPRLGSLQDNGGDTLTCALLPASPAIDAGDNDACPSTDQRKVSRPQDGNEDGSMDCDIGSYEKIPPTYYIFLSHIARD